MNDFETGYKEGYKEGYERKCNDMLIKFALKGIREGLNNKLISNLTGLSRDEIIQLRDFYEKGRKISAYEIAKRAIEIGLDKDLISKLTSLSIDQIKALGKNEQ